jgi:5-methylcytosine-specific restriction endonuclease McrA
MTEEDFYKSEVWINATPEKRREFVSKLRATKRIEKELEAKAEKQRKQDQKTSSRPSVASRRRERAKAKKERKRLRSAGLLTKPTSKVIRVGGVDVVSDAFLQTYEWRKLRMEALKKYTPKCMCCGSTPASGAVMNVDHIKPRRLFPSLAMDINNLQILCHDCNHGKGNWDQTDWRT